MRKIISILLSLALCCLLLPAVAEDSVTGTWYIFSAEQEGREFKIVDPEAITVTLNEDGTATLSAPSFNVNMTGTWELKDSVVSITTVQEVDGKEETTTQEYPLADGMLVYELEGTKVLLSQTAPEPATLPAKVAAESVDAFDGTWKPFAQMSTGLYAELNETEKAAVNQLVIEGGVLKTMMASSEGTMVEAGSYNAELTEGALHAEDSSFFPTTMTVSLLEDGTLEYVVSMSMGEVTMVIDYFYTRAE